MKYSPELFYNNGDISITRIIEFAHFNDDIPENNNIFMPDRRTKQIRIIDDNGEMTFLPKGFQGVLDLLVMIKDNLYDMDELTENDMLNSTYVKINDICLNFLDYKTNKYVIKDKDNLDPDILNEFLNILELISDKCDKFRFMTEKSKKSIKELKKLKSMQFDNG